MIRKNLLKYALIIPALAGLYVLASMPVSAQTRMKNQTVLLDDKDGKVVVDKTMHDFGTIKKDGGSVNTIFTVTNNTKIPILISGVRTSCGCTAPDWTKEPVEPGKTGKVTATYTPTGVGPFEKSVTIIVSEGDKTQTIVVKIKGTVE